MIIFHHLSLFFFEVFDQLLQHVLLSAGMDLYFSLFEAMPMTCASAVGSPRLQPVGFANQGPSRPLGKNKKKRDEFLVGQLHNA